MMQYEYFMVIWIYCYFFRMVVDVVVDGDAQSKNAAKKLAAKAEKLAKVKVQL